MNYFMGEFGRKAKAKKGTKLFRIPIFDEDLNNTRLTRSSVNRNAVAAETRIQTKQGRILGRNDYSNSNVKVLRGRYGGATVLNFKNVTRKVNRKNPPKTKLQQLVKDYSPNRWVKNETGSYVKKFNPKFGGLVLGATVTGAGLYGLNKYLNRNKKRK